MLVKESILRRIIREEAVRILREEGGEAQVDQASPTNPRQRPLQFTTAWNSVHDAIGALSAALATDNRMEAQQTHSALGPAGTNWTSVYKMGKDSPISKSVANTLVNTSGLTPQGVVRAIIATLITKRPMNGRAEGGFMASTDFDRALHIEGGNAPRIVSAIFEKAIPNAAKFIQDVKMCISASVLPAATASTAPAVKTYITKAGDTLSAIALSQLGNVNRVKEIAKLNNISDPNKIQVGMSLKLPAK